MPGAKSQTWSTDLSTSMRGRKPGKCVVRSPSTMRSALLRGKQEPVDASALIV